MTANVRPGATAFPVRGALAGADPWERDDRAEEAEMRAALEEAGARLAAAVLRTRRRLAAERQRQERQRRQRRLPGC